MKIIKKDGPEKIVYKGKIIEVVQQPVKIGDKKKVFEMARRSPGIRLIIVENNKILLTKEYRMEIDNFDYRLPGGKVFDTLEEYLESDNDKILESAKIAVKREALEEAGIIVKKIKYFAISQAGATVKWDLLYFIVDDFEESKNGQELELGENIEVEWKTREEIDVLIGKGLMTEFRSVGVLYKFFLEKIL